MLSREMLDEPARYSRSHCLTRRPSDADSKLHTKLENQKTFIRTANPLGLKGVGGADVVGLVELIRLAFKVKLFSWEDIWARRAVFASSGCCWSNLYDSMLNAVSTAENRPACHTCDE